MRTIVAILAIVFVAYVAWPSADCDRLTGAECERLELINAGAID